MELIGEKKKLFDLSRDGQVPDEGLESLVRSHRDVRDTNQLTPLMVACLNGNLQIFTALMQCNVDVNDVDVYGRNALMMAVMGKKEWMKYPNEAFKKYNEVRSCQNRKV